MFEMSKEKEKLQMTCLCKSLLLVSTIHTTVFKVIGQGSNHLIITQKLANVGTIFA
jgi:hypothetical protein